MADANSSFGKTKPVLGNYFKGRLSQGHLDVPNTSSQTGEGKSKMFNAASNKNTARDPRRPDNQNAYRTISSPALGKAPGWNTRGDNKKKAMGKRVYSMNHVAVARVMKGNVNANEGAYMKRGGDRQV